MSPDHVVQETLGDLAECLDAEMMLAQVHVP